MSGYGERAERALWQAENVIGATPESQARLFLRAQVYATFHLAEVTRQTQATLEALCDRLLTSGTIIHDSSDEKVVNDTDEEKVVGCDHVEGGEIPYPSRGINVWLWFTFCPKCGEKL